MYLFAQNIHFRWLVTSRNSAKRGECSLHHDGNMLLLFGCSFIESWFLELEIFLGKQPLNLDVKPQATSYLREIGPSKQPWTLQGPALWGGVLQFQWKPKWRMQQNPVWHSDTHPMIDLMQVFKAFPFHVLACSYHGSTPKAPGIKAGSEGIMNNIPW